MGVIDSVRAWLSSDHQQSVDTDYLRNETDYRWIEVPDEGQARCNVCGKLLPVSEMPKMMRHVASHDGQGAAEFDPTERGREVASVDYSDLLQDGVDHSDLSQDDEGETHAEHT